MQFADVNGKGGHLDGTGLVRWVHRHFDPAHHTVAIMVNEADGPSGSARMANYLRSRGAKVFGHPSGRTHGERENIIAIFGEWHHHAGDTVQVSPNTNDPKDHKHPFEWYGFGMDRWVTWEAGVDRDGDKWCFISGHDPLGMYTKGFLNLTKQARNWRKARAKIDNIATTYRTLGYNVVYGRDGNEVLSGAFSGTYRWGKRHGFNQIYVDHVMWLMVKSTKKIKFRTIKTPIDVSDHPTAVAGTA